ncbi:growth/differentiation factor 11-like [Haliotis rufescens]|uniref:growth/differentiation factor 11-like n=1 Tax=Haliotis rufescens TaxID=6454 RepID=UPI00201F2EFC|nr:growth/differentiation factor 11-like [Haliotis rufescens]
MEAWSCVNIFVTLLLFYAAIEDVNSNNINRHSSNNVHIGNSTEFEDVDDNATDAINTTASPNLTTQEDRMFEMRERMHSWNRRYRLQRIREQILRSLGWTEPPNIPEGLIRNITNQSYPYTLVGEELETQDDRRCFSASCSLPRNVDRQLWEDEELGGFRVYTSLAARQDIVPTNLRQANLNVFLRHTNGFTCHGEEVPMSISGSRFLVSVYQFLRPLRFQRSRNRVLNRKRLLDARMVTTNGPTWVMFNVKQAVSEWLSGERNNFGFEIIVKDENEVPCNAMNMLVHVNCNSPEETGCREDNSEPAALNRFRWLHENIESNYPYLEIITRQGRLPPQFGRLRARRDLGATSSPVSDVTTASPRNIVRSVGMCQGTEVRIATWESSPYVIAPTSYTTLLCGGTCVTTFNGMLQIVSSRCRPTETRPVMGLYFDDSQRIYYGELPFTQTLQCGC